MPTRPVTGPRKPAPSSVARKGGRKVYFLLIAIVLAVLAALYLMLSRGPSEPVKERTDSVPSASGSVEPDATPDSTEPGITIAEAKLQLESVDNKDTVRVVIGKANGENNSDIVYKFDWTINGKPAGDGSDSLTGFKRGDRIVVKITPMQGEKAGSPKTLDFLISNTAPKIADAGEGKFDGKTFSYQVKGSDQDGDTVSYALEDAPEGMTIDAQTGAINWQLKEGDYGERTIKVKISDGKGGTASRSIKMNLATTPEQKKPGETKK